MQKRWRFWWITLNVVVGCGMNLTGVMADEPLNKDNAIVPGELKATPTIQCIGLIDLSESNGYAA